MVRLTPDLINKSYAYANPLTEQELDLRGHKISAIENLGVARHSDAIDFTDNDIVFLGNFPQIPRLRTLLFNQNRIATIQPSLSSSIPALNILSLTKNRIVELADLDPLAGFTKLTFLSLLGNPVASKENYRYWVIWRIPSVRYLDFARVRQKEREKAEQLFGTADEPTELASTIMGIRSKDYVIPSTLPNGEVASKGRDFTDEERKLMRAAIENAKSFNDIARLEKAFAEGHIPASVYGAEAMDQS